MIRLAIRFHVLPFVLLSCLSIAGPLYAAEGGAPDAAPRGPATPDASPAADARTGPAADQDEGSAADAAKPPSGAEPAPATGATNSDPPGKSPEEFIPSETISEDFNVAFPVDI